MEQIARTGLGSRQMEIAHPKGLPIGGRPHAGASWDALPAKRAAVPPESETRLKTRKIVQGRVSLQLACGREHFGRLLDLSHNGAGVLLNEALPNRTVCTFRCDCFANGRHHAFEVPAEAVYSVLVSGKGFRLGIRFDGEPVLSQISAMLR